MLKVSATATASRLCVLSAAVGVLVLANGAHAAPTLYVRALGNDGADGYSPVTALRSIKVAARKLTTTGGQIIVGPGTYCEGDIAPQLSHGDFQRGPLEFIADRDGSQTGDRPGPVIVDARGRAANGCDKGSDVPWGTGFLMLGESNVRIDGFHVLGAMDAGIQVRYNRGSRIAASNVTVVNCVVFANGKRGIDIQDTAGALIFNNLTYANGSTGISLAGGQLGSANAIVAHNTSVGNGAYGIIIGEGDQSTVSSPNALVLSNVLARNRLAGAKVPVSSRDTFSSGFNVSGDGFYPVLSAAPSDVVGDPLLANPGCLDVIASPPVCTDDDFRLRADSPALDYGPGDAGAMGVTGSTRDDDSPDTGVVDAGYHFTNNTSDFLPAIPRVALYTRGIGKFLPSVTPDRLLFVRQDGDDANDGTTPGSAFRTIRHAAQAAVSGDMVVVAPGHYLEGDIGLNEGGKPEHPLWLIGDSSGKLTGSVPGPVCIDAGGQHDTAFTLVNRSYILIRGFYIMGARQAGIQVRACAGNGDNCKPTWKSENVTVSDNIVFSGHRGIDMTDTANSMVFNNLVYGNASTGIDVIGNVREAANAWVINNTVYRNAGSGVLFSGRIGAPNGAVMNNVIQANQVLGIKTSDSAHTGLFVNHNLNLDGANSKTPTDLGDPGGDTAFVAPAGPDGILGSSGFQDDNFRLSVGRSAAINAGALGAADPALSGRVARSDGEVNSGRADLGFHYPVAGPLPGLPVATGTMFVRASVGNDANDGRSPRTAFRTIARAAVEAVPGTTVVIGPGTYHEYNLRPLVSGTALHPIAFTGDAGGNQTGDPAGPVVVDASGGSTGFRLGGDSYVHLSNLSIMGARLAGVLALDTIEVEIVNCRVFSNAKVGLLIARPRGGNTLFNNLVYGNGGDGVQFRLRSIGDSTIRLLSSTVINNQGRGVWIYRAGSLRRMGAVLVANNIIQNNQSGGDLVVTPRPFPTLQFLANMLSSPPVGVSATSALRVAPSMFGATTASQAILGGVASASDGLDVDLFAPRDAGFGDAALWGLEGGRIRPDGAPDTGVVDLGYHYLH